MMRKIGLVLILILAILLIFILLPSPISSVSWTPEPVPKLEGKYAINNQLDDMERIHEGLCLGCEDVAHDSMGVLYGGTLDGKILKIFKDRVEEFANTGGRPLGLDFDGNDLIVADADKGLLSVNVNGQIEVLSVEHDGLPFKFTDDVEVGNDGKYYFSDASSKFGKHDYVRDLIEHGGHGRLLVYDPKTQSTNLLMDGLQFANGVAVDPDTAFVLVNETGLYCVRKYWLNGPNKGQSELIIDDLPGYPDGISRGTNGVFWLTLASPRDPMVERLMPNAWLRNQIVKLPRSISEPKPQEYGMILGIDADGRILENIQSAKPALKMITSVQEFGDHLYFGSLIDNAIGRLNL